MVIYTANSTTSANPLIAQLVIGRHRLPVSGLDLFDGKLDDLRVYNRDLSSSEIQYLYCPAITQCHVLKYGYRLNIVFKQLICIPNLVFYSLKIRVILFGCIGVLHFLLLFLRVVGYQRSDRDKTHLWGFHSLVQLGRFVHDFLFFTSEFTNLR